MAANKQGKMQNLINYRVRVTLNDGRQMTGQMLAFDSYMNLVLADTEEFRRRQIKRQRTKQRPTPGSPTSVVATEEKRALGLIIVRGTHVISLSVDGPPPADPSARLGTGTTGVGAPAALSTGPGISRPAGRGLPIGLTGPAAGVGPGPAGFGGGFPSAGRGGPPGFPPQGFPGGAPGQGPPGFQPPPGFQAPPGQGRGFPGPPGFTR